MSRLSFLAHPVLWRITGNVYILILIGLESQHFQSSLLYYAIVWCNAGSRTSIQYASEQRLLRSQIRLTSTSITCGVYCTKG